MARKITAHLGPVLEQDREEIPYAPRLLLLLERDVFLDLGSWRVHLSLPALYGYFAGVMIVLDVSTPMIPLPTGKAAVNPILGTIRVRYCSIQRFALVMAVFGT